MAVVVYLHGFNSGPGDKAELLKQRLPEFTVISPTLSYDPDVALDSQIIPLIESLDDRDIHIVGTSLGGFYASYLATVFNHLDYIQYYLINPCMKPTVTFADKVGKVFQNYKTDTEYQITPRMYNVLINQELEVVHDFVYTLSNPKYLPNFQWYIGRNDTEIDHKPLLDTLYSFKQPVKIRFSDQDHRHQNIDEVILDIRRNQYLFV
jgi:predicted esterase YcpF (UPF0227 family)